MNVVSYYYYYDYDCVLLDQRCCFQLQPMYRVLTVPHSIRGTHSTDGRGLAAELVGGNRTRENCPQLKTTLNLRNLNCMTTGNNRRKSISFAFCASTKRNGHKTRRPAKIFSIIYFVIMCGMVSVEQCGQCGRSKLFMPTQSADKMESPALALTLGANVNYVNDCRSVLLCFWPIELCKLCQL